MLVGSIAGVILSIFPACGKAPVACDGDTLMNDGHAYACADRASLGFAQEFGSGTYIGQKPQEALSIRNGGAVDLAVSEVSFSGDSAFAMSVEPVAPANIKGNKSLFIQVTFAPTQAQGYSGTITVKSNAANVDGGVQVFAVTGCGVPVDSNRACALDADCADANQRCKNAPGDGGKSGYCVGVSPCYRDGGVGP
jgi:hypothetical protein